MGYNEDSFFTYLTNVACCMSITRGMDLYLFVCNWIITISNLYEIKIAFKCIET
jgi:hypothetical protein